MDLTPTVWAELFRAADEPSRRLLLELSRSVSRLLRPGCTVCTTDYPALMAGVPLPNPSVFPNLAKVTVRCNALQISKFFSTCSRDFVTFNGDGISLSMLDLSSWLDFGMGCSVDGALEASFEVRSQAEIDYAMDVTRRCPDLQSICVHNRSHHRLSIPVFFNATVTQVSLVNLSCDLLEVPRATYLEADCIPRTLKLGPLTRGLLSLTVRMASVGYFPPSWESLKHLDLEAFTRSQIDIIRMPRLETLRLTNVDLAVGQDILFRLQRIGMIVLHDSRVLRLTPAEIIHACHRNIRLTTLEVLLTSFSAQEASDWASLVDLPLKFHMQCQVKDYYVHFCAQTDLA